MRVTFEWDENKASRNVRQHKVSFGEAKTVFGDSLSLTITDPAHSDSEDRYIDIGRSANGHLLTVVYVERGSSIRLISARRATPAERRQYEEGQR